MVRSKKAAVREKSPAAFSESSSKKPQRSRSRSAVSSKKGKPSVARSKSRSRKRAESKPRRPKTRSRSRSKSKSPLRRSRARSRSRSLSAKNTPITRSRGRSLSKKVDPPAADFVGIVEQKKPILGYKDVFHDDYTSKESKLNEIIRRSISRELSQEKTNTYRIPTHKSLLTNFKEEPKNIDGMSKKEPLVSLPKTNRLASVAEWLGTLTGVTVAPFAVLMLHLICSRNQCTIQKFHFPRNWKYYLNLESAEIVTGFIFLQAILLLLPIGKRVDGPPGINGTLHYRCNGLLSTLITVGLTAALWRYKIPVTIVYDKLISLIVSSIIIGYLVGLFLFIKGGRAPVPGLNPDGIVGSRLKQFFVGREVNPTLFRKLNIKTVLIRTCLNGALLLNALLVLKAYEAKRELSYGMVICVALNALLVLDFFWFENNYPLTFEAMYQGTGCSLTLGYLLFPFLPALITKYIIQQKVELPVWAVVAVIVGFTIGFVIYRASSLQKAAFRKCPLNPALTQLEAISTNRGKKLLVSGWWGWVRHPNYLGTIIFYWAWASVAGYSNAAPYAVPIIVTTLLILRAKSVDNFCSKRYQSAWDEYCSRVRYRIFPRVY